MTPPAPCEGDPFALWWTETRQGIHRWLDGHAPPLAELYLGLHRLLCDRPPGWTRFVAHGLREIANRLPGAICGEEVSRSLRYAPRIDALVKLWDPLAALDASQTLTGASSPGLGAVLLPQPFAAALRELIEDHRSVDTKNRERALAMIRAVVPENDAEPGHLQSLARQWTDIGNWATGVAHDQSHQDHERDEDDMIRQVQALETILLGITRPFFENKEDIDALLEDANS